MNRFINTYRAYLWIKECKKYDKSWFCANYQLARKSMKLLLAGLEVNPQSLMKKIKHLPFSLSKEEMITEFRKLPFLPVKDELERYILLYEPNAKRVEMFLNGYNSIMKDNASSIVTGFAKIAASKINIRDETMKQKLSSIPDVVIVDLGSL